MNEHEVEVIKMLADQKARIENLERNKNGKDIVRLEREVEAIDERLRKTESALQGSMGKTGHRLLTMERRMENLGLRLHTAESGITALNVQVAMPKGGSGE